MNTNKQNITMILGDVHREGMSELVEYLEGTDFFSAPASIKHHCAYIGGLAEHSMNVYHMLDILHDRLDIYLPSDSLIITSLLHDVCKANYYVQEPAWRKDDRGKWESYIRWGVNDQLPLGHGEKSLYLVSRFIPLSDSEASAIRWHMGAWTPGMSDYAMSMAYNAAVNKYPLVTLLETADNMASRLIEKGVTV
jgi:hypothetical protein